MFSFSTKIYFILVYMQTFFLFESNLQLPLSILIKTLGCQKIKQTAVFRLQIKILCFEILGFFNNIGLFFIEKVDAFCYKILACLLINWVYLFFLKRNGPNWIMPIKLILRCHWENYLFQMRLRLQVGYVRHLGKQSVIRLSPKKAREILVESIWHRKTVFTRKKLLFVYCFFELIKSTEITVGH